MIIWDYKESLSEMGNKVQVDRKAIKAVAKNMYLQGISKSNIEKEIYSFFPNIAENEPIKKQIFSECKKLKKDGNKFRPIVFFSDEELQKIKEIEEKDVQKVLFCMEVYCKAYCVNYIYFCERSEVKIKDIMTVAKVPFSVKRFCYIMRQLYLLGRVNVEPNMKVSLCGIRLDLGDGADVNVSKNCEEWLEVYMGRGIFCQRCGSFVKKKGNNKKYCQKCAEEVKKQRDKIRKLKI